MHDISRVESTSPSISGRLQISRIDGAAKDVSQVFVTTLCILNITHRSYCAGIRPLLFLLTYIATARTGLIILCVAPRAKGESGTRRQVGGMCQHPMWHGALRKRSGRAPLTGASMRLFDTSSDKRPPYYLPIVSSSSSSSSSTVSVAFSHRGGFAADQFLEFFLRGVCEEFVRKINFIRYFLYAADIFPIYATLPFIGQFGFLRHWCAHKCTSTVVDLFSKYCTFIGCRKIDLRNRPQFKIILTARF